MTRAGKARTATRKCATCGQPFTWTSRNPKRRFCDPNCKARWWRASNNDAGTGARTVEPAAVEPATNTRQPRTRSTAEAGTANAVTHPYDPYVSGYRTDQAPTGIQNCPNCHQPVAVINLLVQPAAAYVNTPSRSVTSTK
ncbi:MAG: hypothetical protein JWN00_56 [Actinomycetia bacterium]|nr:hypothetical protein [Actinomycetes bacterium]